MPRYRIINTLSGVELGEYDGSDEHDALDTMAREAGYGDFHEACGVAPVADGELHIEPVSQPPASEVAP
jgi:hypothetical protein